MTAAAPAAPASDPVRHRESDRLAKATKENTSGPLRRLNQFKSVQAGGISASRGIANAKRRSGPRQAKQRSVRADCEILILP
jgi:hypothetical protein